MNRVTTFWSIILPAIGTYFSARACWNAYGWEAFSAAFLTYICLMATIGCIIELREGTK